MTKLIKMHVSLFVGAAITLGVLLIFMILQSMHGNVLELDTRWVVVSCIPILISLVTGGYIEWFKGFGIELKARLRKPIMSIDLLVTDVIRLLPVEPKKTLAYLQKKPESERNKKRGLSLVEGNQTYETPILGECMKLLPNLQYFVIITKSKVFQGLIPVGIFKSMSELDVRKLDTLVDSIRGKAVLTEFGEDVIQLTVREDQNLIEVLHEIKNAGQPFAVVVSKSGEFRGIAEASNIANRIAEEVMKVSK